MELKERYYLKSYCIGYEVPFFDINNQTGQDDLARGISDEYQDWFDVLDVNLKILQLPNTNCLLLFNIIVRIDMNLIDQDSFESEWEKMKTGISNHLENYLKSNNLIYQILNDIGLQQGSSK